MSNFRPFAAAVRAKFEKMSKQELYVVDIDGDLLYETYLDAFPEGTNEIYRTRREYDCSADKNFIRNIGNVVAIVNGGLTTVWDVTAEAPFNVVVAKLDALVRDAPIKTLFRTKQPGYGAELLRELNEDKSVTSWYNFNGKIASKHLTNEPEEVRGRYNTLAQVFRRGLDELHSSAVAQVLDLIQDDMIYRGAEFKAKVVKFNKLQKEYLKLNSDQARNNFIWANLADGDASGFRNTVIGTLVEDLSSGRGLESAVKAFEDKMAGGNYKRSKSLITPAMIKDAMKTINDLNLEPALERRFAVISDVSVNNVLFVDNAVRGAMKGGLEGLLMTEAKPKKASTEKALDISIDQFLENVLPNARSIEVQVKNAHQGNFMSLTAPVHDEVEPLFKWGNNFAWSYDGNITDSDIRAKVARAGGNVTNAKLRVSLAWFNTDDLDIHVTEPDGNTIYYANRDSRSGNGSLDVDMNAFGRLVRNAVENVSWTSLRDGVYNVKVNNFSHRESIDVGFQIEVESGGTLHHYSYGKSVSRMVPVLDITIKGGLVADVKMHKDVSGNAVSQEKWGIKTEAFVPVDSVMLSPNYWDENATGNKHWFFILKDCLNPEPVRGIYNEFLKPGLEKHRKVFEILGDKTKAEPTPNQLSGLGFSSTKRDSLVVQVKGDKAQKLYNVNF